MRSPHSDDGLYSESQLPKVIPDDNGKGKQPLVEPPVPPIEGTRPRNTMSILHSHDELSSESQSQVFIPIVDVKGKKPLEELPMSQASTSGPPSGETSGLQDCTGCFRFLVGHDADYKTSAFEAGDLLPLLKCFELAPDLTKDELRDMLKLSGYADENGIIDFERFTVFAEDFQLLESLRIYRAGKLLNVIDVGPLGDFFTVLDAVDDSGFTNYDFNEAFRSFEMELTDESVDSLVRYADLHESVKITFDDFLKVLRREDEEYMQQTGRRTVSRRIVALDKGCRVGRLMAFVSAYTRSEHFVRKRQCVLENDIENDIETSDYFPLKPDRTEQPRGNAS